MRQSLIKLIAFVILSHIIFMILIVLLAAEGYIHDNATWVELLLTIIDEMPFMEIVFKVLSASGNVGWNFIEFSTSGEEYNLIHNMLNDLSKSIVCFTVFTVLDKFKETEIHTVLTQGKYVWSIIFRVYYNFMAAFVSGTIAILTAGKITDVVIGIGNQIISYILSGGIILLAIGLFVIVMVKIGASLLINSVKLTVEIIKVIAIYLATVMLIGGITTGVLNEVLIYIGTSLVIVAGIEILIDKCLLDK